MAIPTGQEEAAVKRYKHDVNPDHLVTRHLRLDAPPADALGAGMAALEALPGVQEVSWHPQERVLNLVYDPGVDRIEEVESVLEAQGLALREDWHARLAESLWRIDESLRRASLEETPPHTLSR